MTESEFDLWGNLGESWWKEQGRLCRCSERQIKFAAALYQKCTQHRAAAIAGYPGDPQQLSVQGSRAAASDRVRDLLALAEAQDGGALREDLITSGEIDRRISRMIRSPDPGTSLKATELWHKLEDKKRERGTAPSDDGWAEARAERDMVAQGPDGACSYLHLFRSLQGDLGHVGNLNLTHDTYYTIMRHPLGRALWEHDFARLSEPMKEHVRRQLADPNWQIDVRRKLWAEIGMAPPAPISAVATDSGATDAA
jgi:hypothetical protein